MKLAFRLFLKIFLFMGFAYGGMHALVFYFFSNEEEWLLRSLVLGLGFGLMMGLFLTYKQMREVKKLRGKELTQEDLSVHQLTHFQSALTKEEMLAKLQNNYPSKDWKLTENGSHIRLKTTYSWKSFGEKIQIKVEQLQNGFSDVIVVSKPLGWITLADYGKNLENILYLKHLLTA